VFSKLDGDGIMVNSIFSVFNVNAVANFALLKQKYEARAAINSELFFAESWKEGRKLDLI
jgi:hypothetical protein